MKQVKDRIEYLDAVNWFMFGTLTVAEIGVFHGDFSQMLLDALQPKQLILIDPFDLNNEFYGDNPIGLQTAYSTEDDYQIVKNKFQNNDKVKINRKYSYDAVHDYPDEYFDMIYIDACHLYHCVKQDLNDWLPKLLPYGLLCGHDYLAIHKDFGVIQAVDEFMKEKDMEMLIISPEGDFALKRKEYI